MTKTIFGRHECTTCAHLVEDLFEELTIARGFAKRYGGAPSESTLEKRPLGFALPHTGGTT